MNGQFQLSRGRGTLAMNDDDDDETRGEVSFKLVRGLRKSFAFPRLSLSLFFAKLASGIRNDHFSMSRWSSCSCFFNRGEKSIESWRLSFEISAEFIGICCLKICNGKRGDCFAWRR